MSSEYLPAERVLNEIIQQGMIKLAHPAVDTPCVFVWSANCIEQLDAAIHSEYKIPTQFQYNNLVELVRTYLSEGGEENYDALLKIVNR